MKLVLVAAVAENGVIGRANAMPWHIPSDLKHFRRLTFGKPVVMGRKTFESIGKPLVGRTNIVVTRDPQLCLPGAVVAHDLAAGLSVARGDALRRGGDEIMVIGGGDIFCELMPRAQRLEITRVHEAPAGDAFFPKIDPAAWQEIARAPHPAGPADSAAFTTLTYIRG